MIKQLWDKWKQKDIEQKIFFFFLPGMAFYYGFRLFALTPWYDELYTYYYFISRGPVYAAIHWPLPNNHVGYSVLSAVLDLLGSPAVGLRGVSWFSSLFSLLLLFKISRKWLPKGFALLPVFLFASMGIVNQLAVQGRGYALAACLYLTALWELLKIVGEHDCRKGNYIVTGLAFVWALYTLPSSVYFVLPLCIAGGAWLLLEKRGRELGTLFFTALFSALCTVFLYALIWLAIGSNLLSRAQDGCWYGQGHISIILHAPFAALKTGVCYMLDTPYIQSVSRDGYLGNFAAWLKALFENYYAGMSAVLLTLTGIGVGVLLVGQIRGVIRGAEGRKPAHGFLEWYLLLTFLLTPLMLIVQAALPYYRVFSFMGVPLALLTAWLLAQISVRVGRPAVFRLIEAFAGIGCVCLLLSPAGRAQYSGREAAIEDACVHMDLRNGEAVCVTDCDQEYLMKYLYGAEGRPAIEEADYVLLDRELFLTKEEMESRDAAGADAWKFYVSHEEIPWDYLAEKMTVRYENDRFVLYQKK
ncbi:MAG: glycosyltransferase family 39 protein [Blautia sp.]|nr:glycosyltransferase family 39 protein [Blautia sp.]MCM1201905.1 glycosyltransferase family 39 protein [Bacteroides fragilis]